MTEYPLTWLADVLRAAGCRVIEESGWKTRGRPSSTGSFHPRAVLHHWDASAPGSHGALSTVINGSADVPGPYCSILTCRGNSSHAPSVHVIAAGRCNHGGTGDGWGVIPRDDANTYAAGHEIAQTVDQPWPADQLDQVRRAEAAILAKLGANASDAYCAHSEYAPDRKIDTTEGSYGQDMSAERRAVQALIDNPDSGGDDMRHYWVDLTCTKGGQLSSGGKFLSWDKEGGDTGNAHTAGQGAIFALWGCTMNGVLQIQVLEGTADVEIDRYDADGEYVNRVGYLYGLGVGTFLLPFVGIWSEGQKCYAFAKGTGELGNVRIMLDQLERTS